MHSESFAEVLGRALEVEPLRGFENPEPGTWNPEPYLFSIAPVVPGWSARKYLSPVTRVRRTLGPAERHAFDELVGLGARLRDDFTAAELRSAYRELARRHHPDRWIGGSDQDRMHAGRIFTFITAHYRCLASAGAA